MHCLLDWKMGRYRRIPSENRSCHLEERSLNSHIASRKHLQMQSENKADVDGKDKI